jgi:hypothetical protein
MWKSDTEIRPNYINFTFVNIYIVLISEKKIHVIGQKVDIGIEASSVNQVHNHSATPTFKDYFQMSWKLHTITTVENVE